MVHKGSHLVMGICVSDDISEQHFTHRHLRHDVKPSNNIPQQSLIFQKLHITYKLQNLTMIRNTTMSVRLI